MNKKRLLGLFLALVMLAGLVPGVFTAAPAMAAATTSITITKYAADGTTVLDQEIVDYTWMEENLPPCGNGVTHYYHQGPTFDAANLWDSGIAPEPAPGETISVDNHDMGAVMGSDLRDLLALVGGAPAGSEIEVRATDPFFKIFSSDNINAMVDITPVICWYNDDYGYVSDDYDTGMRLVFFDDNTNVDGKHVFGNWDMHQTLDEEYWHYYSGQWPSSSGLSVQNVAYINIYTDVDVLYDGTVDLTPGATFDKVAYNSSLSYTVNMTTPLGALETAAAAAGFTYDVSDKNYGTSGSLLLDNIGTYLYQKTPRKAWYAYVNDVYKDGYNNPAGGLNLIELVDGDKVEFYYVDGTVADPTDVAAVKAAAGAAVKTVASIASAMDVLYDGTVNLTPGATFDKVAYNSSLSYSVNMTTPLGALETAAAAAGFTYDVTDKNYGTSGALLLDNVGSYMRKSPGYWYTYVNDVYKDGYNNPAGGLNLIELVDGDKVEFYYAADIATPENLSAVLAVATAAVKTVAYTGVTPTDWTLQLAGAKDMSVTRAYFEDGLACSSSGHQVFWTDDDSNEWGGVPLWLLVAMVDDDPDEGPDHFNFNDSLAAQHYEVKVIGSDGWSAVFDSANIARSDDYIVANTVNGGPLLYGGDKPSWPLHLKGSAVLGGQQVGGVVRIELNNLPEPPTGWALEVVGEVGDTITQQEFEEGLACAGSGHYLEWVDIEGNTWSGVPLWVLLGVADDIELASHWTFSDSVAATDYKITIIADDGFSRDFYSLAVARNDDYIVANMMNGAELPESSWPLRLVGPGVTKSDGSLGGSAVGAIVKIEIPDLQTPEPEPGSYNLTLKGKITDVLSQAEIEEGLACPSSGHLVTWTQNIKDTSGVVIETHEWSGIPLWFLCGWVDDRQPHEFNAIQAMAGYKITVKAPDGYAKDFQSADVAWSSDYIVATVKDGAPLPEGKWPLQLVGDPLTRDDGTLGGMSVGQIFEIELTEFGVPVEIPSLHIVKYGDDGITVIDEQTIDYTGMMTMFDVIGDGVTQYKFQGVTLDPEDIWGETDESKGGYKISNAVKGTRLYDLVSLVGGMGVNTDLVLVASDGYKTILPYTSINTTTEIQNRQGDAVLAWYADGKYVPSYSDGMRLYFMPGDTVYGQWDMHETMPPGYWHYYYQSYSDSDPVYGEYAPGVLYPSCAGLSAKYVAEIRVYSKPPVQWDLELDGTGIGGLTYTVNKTYFEQALACQFGANHKVSYTDGNGDVWEGMPLWFLAGFVDDQDLHSSNSFNDALAQAGYRVVITASDGYSVTIDSTEIIRNSNYIVANTRNGFPLPDTDDDWPLRLVGPSVSGGLSISQITSIELLPYIPPIDFNVSSLFINFTWYQPNRDDNITGKGTFSLPEGAEYNLSTDDVIIDIDGVVIEIPAGSFKKIGRWERYQYTNSQWSPWGHSCFWSWWWYPWMYYPAGKVTVDLDFSRGTWELSMKGIDASAVNSYDGVTVELTIGEMVGTSTINMLINGLSFTDK